MLINGYYGLYTPTNNHIATSFRVTCTAISPLFYARRDSIARNSYGNVAGWVAVWLGTWVGGCPSQPVLYQND